MRRVLLSLAMVMALLIPMASVRPQPASAGDLASDICSFFSSCRPFGAAPPPDCRITNVGAKVFDGGDHHQYEYDMTGACGLLYGVGSSTDPHVVGDYIASTKRTDELITVSQGRIHVGGTCDSDPWIYAPGLKPGCNLSLIEPPILVANNLHVRFPYSVEPIPDIDRRGLNGQLQNAIHQLQASVQGNSAPAPAPISYRSPQTADGWPYLELGTQGVYVTAAQDLLLDHGANLPGIGLLPGKFNQEMQTAVHQWEQGNGVPDTGAIGAPAWEALIITVQQGDNRPAVKAVQELLNDWRENVVVDGDFGAQTADAVQDFQRKQQQHHPNFVVDGIVGPQTWQALLAGR